MSERKFAILSHVLPPAWSGQAVVLYRLLEKVSPEEYCLITAGREDGNATYVLPARLWQLDTPLKGWERLATLSHFLVGRTAKWQVQKRARQIEKILRENSINMLIACSGDLLDIPAGALAAKRAGIFFVPYMFDDYLYQWTSWQRRSASFFERMAMMDAAGAIVPNEFQADAYRLRYGIECQVVRNPVFPKTDIGGGERSRVVGRKRIVYTGSVYHAHYDAFHNLIKMLNIEKIADLELYTAQSEKELAKNGITGPHVRIFEHVGQEESLRVQREADILFLPLAFKSSVSELLRTSSPGKMGEYLASGRPILVHAPADSFLSWFFRKHRCGEVLVDPDGHLLGEAVKRLLVISDETRCMIARADSLAATEFNTKCQANIFYEYLHSIMGRQS